MNEFDISGPPFTGHCSLIAYPDMKETVMKVKVTTREFIRLLQAAKEFDQQFPWLGQVVWLLDHWTDVTDDYVGLSFPDSFGLPLFLDS